MSDFGLHWVNYSLDLFFIFRIIQKECFLKSHNSVNNQLQLIAIQIFLTHQNIVISKDLRDKFVDS